MKPKTFLEWKKALPAGQGYSAEDAYIAGQLSVAECVPSGLIENALIDSSERDGDAWLSYDERKEVHTFLSYVEVLLK